MLLLQAQETAYGAATAGYGFTPWLPGLILLLPLLGFLINGVLALIAARNSLPQLPPVGDPYWETHAHQEPSEAEGLDRGHHPHPGDPAQAALADDADHHGHHHAADDHHADDHHGHEPARPKAFTHTLPSLVAPGVVGLAFLVAVMNFLRMLSAHPEEPAIVTYWSWMPVGELQVDAAIQLDQLSMLMTLIVTGVGFLIHIFSIGYMKEDPGYPRYMAYLNLFIFFMLILVLGSSYPLMFVGWEGVGLCSYLLIGFWFAEKANADAGKKAFIVNRIGDFGFLVAMFLIFANLGTLNFVEVFALAPERFAFGGALVTAIGLFFFLGATGKSAQIPLYTWLPDAMAGPTPVSALIHAATMVTAGVYLIARSSVLFAMAPAASLTVALVGALTAIFAASIGLKQWDIKKVLAYSTVSQLGFMFAAVGMGAYVAGVFHLMTHAFFKALLFLGSGAVIHAMHHALHATHNPADAQDMRNMGGLRRYLPITFWTMAIATLAIAGIPGFAGFFSKDEIINAAWSGAGGYSGFSDQLWLGIEGRYVMGFIWGTLSIAAFMTAFYMGRLMLYTFFGPFRGGAPEERHLHEVSPLMTVPLLVLAFLSVFGGWLNIENAPIVRLFNVFGQGTALHDWLHAPLAGAEQVMAANLTMPDYVPHPATPILLAIVIGAGGLALAWLLLKPARLRPAAEEPAYESTPERVLYNKWYIDELYDTIVVRPVDALARAFYSVVDRGVIDGVIDGTARLAQGFGLLFGRAQSGQLNTYAFTIIVGVLLVLGVFVIT